MTAKCGWLEDGTARRSGGIEWLVEWEKSKDETQRTQRRAGEH
jgi:hypothetical protein